MLVDICRVSSHALLNTIRKGNGQSKLQRQHPSSNLLFYQMPCPTVLQCSAGFLLGSRQTLLETLDGGNTWEPRDIEAARDEGFNYRYAQQHTSSLIPVCTVI